MHNNATFVRNREIEWRVTEVVRYSAEISKQRERDTMPFFSRYAAVNESCSIHIELLFAHNVSLWTGRYMGFFL